MILALGALASPVSARAQNPFGESTLGSSPFGVPATAGDAGSPFGGFDKPVDAEPAAAASASSEIDAKEANPVVLLLRDNPPASPSEFAQALTWMMRFRRWDEVGRLMDVVSAKNWSLAELAELSKSGDPALWLRLSVDEAGLNDSQRGLLDNIMSAQSKLARDPANVDRWIDRLAHAQPGERRLAQLRLQDGGEVAIERLLSRLLAGDTKVDAGMLAGTVSEFGETGRAALRAACLVKDPERAGRAILGIAEVPGQEFSAELGAALFNSRLTPTVKNALSERMLQRYSKLPSIQSVHAYLDKQYQTKLAEYQELRTANSLVLETVWRQTPDGNSVQAVKSFVKENRLEAVAQLAAQRMQLSIATTEDLVDCGAVVLQRAYRAKPTLDAGEIQSVLLTSFDQVATLEAGFWIRVFDRATELQMHGGAVRALQMLVQTSSMAATPLDFLSRLLGDSRPIVRFIALATIADVGPSQSFAGAEKSLGVALEMARLGSGPHALVIGNHSEQRQAAQQQLEIQIGANVTTVHSARTALQSLDRPTPVEMILIVDRVADQSIYELLQRLRVSERGRDLPIAVMTDELYQHERRLIAETPGVVTSLLVSNPQEMNRVVNLLIDRLDTAPFTVQERAEFAWVATQYLSKISSDRDKYAFYPISDLRVELAMLGQGMATDSRVELLSGLGTKESQLQLLALASQFGIAGPQRWNAATAFAKSLRRFGLNLKRQDVLQVYDLYNELGPGDPDTAKSLGLALDAIEAHAGKKAWPEGL